MIAVYYILRCNPFFFGTDGDGHSVFVGAADKDHVFFFQSQIADVDVGRYIHPCQVSDMNGTVGIGQRRCHGGTLEFLFHCIYVSLLL